MSQPIPNPPLYAASHIRRIFLHPVLAAAMGSQAERRSTDGTIGDSCDGYVPWKLWDEMGSEMRNIVLMLFYDPFQLFKDCSKYSCAPIMGIIQNLPPSLRWDPVAAHLFCIQAGTRDRACVPSHWSMMELVADDLQLLAQEGVMVEDRSRLDANGKGEEFRWAASQRHVVKRVCGA